MCQSADVPVLIDDMYGCAQPFASPFTPSRAPLSRYGGSNLLQPGSFGRYSTLCLSLHPLSLCKRIGESESERECERELERESDTQRRRATERKKEKEREKVSTRAQARQRWLHRENEREWGERERHVYVCRRRYRHKYV